MWSLNSLFPIDSCSADGRRQTEASMRSVPVYSWHARTNGKAERFIQTALREWAYARTYQNSADREQHLAP
jgi:hypothetical protein